MTTTPSPQAQGQTWCGLLAGLALAGALALALGLGTERGTPVRAWTEPLELTVLHTNDMHGQVLEPKGRSAGLVALGRAIRQERDAARRAGREVLLLDAGDIFQGTPEGNLTGGEVMVAWMNHVGYDALAIGNHEFDYGMEIPRALARRAAFPFLGANIVETTTRRRPGWLGKGQGALAAAALQRTYRAGSYPVQVAVIGLTTSAMKDVTLAGVTDGLEFRPEVEALEDVLLALPPQDLVIVLTHSGLETDRALARRFAGRIDLIVGGHSHTTLPEGERVGDVLIVQAGDKTRFLGRVELTVRPPDPQGPRDARPQVEARASLVPAGDDLEAALAPFVARVQEKAGQPVGRLTAPLRRVRGYGSSALGNLHTDLMRELTGADVALHNKTGIRADLAAGEVLWRDVYQVAPFGNTVYTLRMRGRDLRDLLEGMLDSTGKLLELSGAVVVCDPERPAGQRLREVTIGGGALDPEETYLVATNSFLAQGGDGHPFPRALESRDTGYSLLDLLTRFFERHSPFTPPAEPEARIVVRVE